MSAAEEVFHTEEYDTSEEFVDEVLEAFDKRSSVFVHGPDYEEYGYEALVEASKKAAADNFWESFSLNPLNWLNPDMYRVTKEETEEGLRISYLEV